MPAPTLSLSAPSTAFTDESFIVDARLSTGISTSPQSDGSSSVTIDFGDGFTANLLATGHAYLAAGTYTITLTGKASDGSSSQTTASITISDIPAASGGGIQTLTDTGNQATNKTNLQTAINTAAAANSVEQEIVVPVTFSIIGDVVLTRPTGGTKYITIKSANLSSLTRNKRVSTSDTSNMPTIKAPTTTSASTPALWTPNPAAANPSHHYRLQGINFSKQDTNQAQVLVSLGDHNVGQNAYTMQPTYFIVDRCYFDGGTTGISNLGMRLAADNVTVKDSYFTGFKVISGIDACAIAYSKGKGPLSVWNNYLEASSENFYVGATPIESWSATVSSPTTTSATLSSVTGLEVDMNIALPVGGATTYSVLYSTIVRSIVGNNITFDVIGSAPFSTGTAKWAITPSFIEFRRNYCFKPLTWRVSDPSYAGTHWQIKNLWETKFARYVIVDGNYLQNSWVDAQAFPIALTPRNFTGGEGPWDVVRQLQFSNNIFRNLGNGVSIAAFDDQIGNSNETQLTSDITFRNNLFRNVGEAWDPTGGPYRQFFCFTSTTSPVRVKRTFIIHNTFDSGTYTSTGMAATVFGTNGDGSGVTSGDFLNNTLPGIGGFFSSSSGVPATNVTQFMAPGDTTNWDKNFVVNTNTLTFPAGAITQSLSYPSAVFNDASNGDFSLKTGISGKSAALDGTDCGINMTTLTAATLHSVDGDWSSAAPPPGNVTTSNVRLFILVV